MKTYFLLGILALSLLFACKKEDGDIAPSKIWGTWELRKSIGGIAGQSTEYAPGNGSLMTYSADNYQIFSDHKLIKSGKYTFVKEVEVLSKKEGNRILYDNGHDAIGKFFELDGDIMWIHADAYDVPSVMYQKIKK